MNDTLKKLRFLYEQSGMGDAFEKDLNDGKIAKINLNDNFDFSKYAQVYTSIIREDNQAYQYFIFKPNYFYKNSKLFYVEDKNKKIIHKSREINL